MTLEEKKEELIKTEWEFFQKVENEGGRASCQEDPKTFFIMRRSQFAPWPEDLTDSYGRDLRRALEEGRNPLAEKYAWMMKSTAPEAFEKIRHHLPEVTEYSERVIEQIVERHLAWMEDYGKRYPKLASGNRALRSSQDSAYETSFETYLRGELCTYSENTLLLYLSFLKELEREGKSLSLLIMDSMVKAYGYAGLEDAEARLSGSANGEK